MAARKVYEYLLSVIVGGADKANSQLSGMARAAGALDRAADKAQRGMSSLGAASASMLGNLSADVILGAATKVFSYADALAETRRETINLATATGLSLDTLGGLGYAASMAGIDVKEVRDGLQDFGEVLFDASMGGGRASDALELLNVELKNSDGTLRDTDAVLREVLNKFVKLAPSAEKNAIAQQLWGDAGNRLNAALGSGTIDDWTDAARRAGVVMDEEAIRATQDWERAIGGLQTAIDTVSFKVFDGMSGQVTEFVNGLSTGMVFVASVIEDVFANVSAHITRAAALTKAIKDADVQGIIDGVYTEIPALDFEAMAAKAIDAARAQWQGTNFAADAMEGLATGSTAGVDSLAAMRKKAAEAAERESKAVKEMLKDQQRITELLFNAADARLTSALTMSDSARSSMMSDADATLERLADAESYAAEAVANPVGMAIDKAMAGITDIIGTKLIGAVSAIVPLVQAAVQLPDTLRGITAAINQLDEALMDIPQAAIELLEGLGELPQALIDALPQIVMGLAEFTFKAFTWGFEAFLDMLADLFDAIPGRIADAIANGIRAIVSELNPFDGDGNFLGTDLTAEKGERRLLGLKVPFFETGGEVAKTGLAYVHEGERVVSVAERMQGQRGGNPVVVNVHTSDPRVMVDTIRRATGLYGVGGGLGVR